MKIHVDLNGTVTNPFHKWGLTQNPFLHSPKMEYDGACRQLASLGGDPIPHNAAEGYIRKCLTGFSPEFVDLCVAQFRPGEMVRFEVFWEG
jgi:hypothetical protein